jgi:hypothetical protein
MLDSVAMPYVFSQDIHIQQATTLVIRNVRRVD